MIVARPEGPDREFVRTRISGIRMGKIWLCILSLSSIRKIFLALNMIFWHNSGPSVALDLPAVNFIEKQMDIIGTAQNPLPGGAISGYFRAKDGVRLRYARWKPTFDGKSKGTVAVFTGRGEFIEKYFEVVSDLRRRGFHVAVMDWRGQGRSDRLIANRLKGYVKSFADYEKDVTAFLDKVILPHSPPPYYALAHSMGGTVMLHYAAKTRPVWFQRMVITSPMIALTRKSLPMPMVRMIAAAASAVGLSTLNVPGEDAVPAEEQDFATNTLSSDKIRFERSKSVLKALPELSAGTPTFAWLHASFRAMDAFADKDFIARIEIPVLLIAAGRDKIVSRRAIERLGKQLPAGGSITIDGAMHDLQIEQDKYRDQFWAAFDAFIPGSSRDE